MKTWLIISGIWILIGLTATLLFFTIRDRSAGHRPDSTLSANPPGDSPAPAESAAQRAENLRQLLDPTPTAREVIEAKINADREHDDYLLWLAGLGAPADQYRYATNELYKPIPEGLATDTAYLNTLTNFARMYLEKAADQNYAPALQLLVALPPAP